MPLLPRTSRLLPAALLLLGLGAPALTLVGCRPKQPETPVTPAPRRVSALGRIEPETKIRKVSVSSSLSGDRVEELLVEENQIVKKGQPMAVLNSYGTLKAALDEANRDVEVAQNKLVQVKAGAKQGEIRAQEYKIKALESRLAAEKLSQDQNVASKRSRSQEAKTEAQRFEALFRNGGASELERDRYRTRAETSLSELNEAIETREGTLSTLRAQILSEEQTLAKIREVRPEDVATAESQLQKAIAARDRAKQEFSYATVTAPQDGQILKIIARPGDKIGDDGLLEMADTSKMVVTAEVYQTDMQGIHAGQGATITADGFKGSLRATVYQVNRQVQRQSIFAGEPGENMDQRVFEVKLRLDPEDLKRTNVKSASNLQVNVVFDPPAAGETKPSGETKA
ncbi:MAG: HlyD family efflux transporter periplasmic adaptor subunit [Cyanobium sp.]